MLCSSQVQAAVVNDKFNSPQTTDQFIEAAATYGPLTTRLALSGQLEQPMFSLMLQRNTIDVSGDNGVVSVGRLPDGIDNSSLTWLPVRLYTPEEGGLNPPNFAPEEVYPLRWEVPLDAVYIDGKQVENNAGKGVTALIDTVDMITHILSAYADTDSRAILSCAARTRLCPRYWLPLRQTQPRMAYPLSLVPMHIPSLSSWVE